MKLKFDWQHVLYIGLAVACAATITYEHSPLLGNPHPEALGAPGWIALALGFATTLASLLTRSPADNWKLLVGLLQQVPPPPDGGPSSGLPYRTTPAPATYPSDQPTPAVKRTTVIERVSGVWRGIGHWIQRSEESSTAIVVSCCVTGAALFAVSFGLIGGCTPAKVATAEHLGTEVACIFTDTESGKTPEQAAVDCGVSVQDVFDIISLADKRALKIINAMSVDAGADAGADAR